MAARIPLGELLVEAQIISREQLEEVLTLQRKDGRRLGTLLVESGLVTETQVTQILSQQLAVPWVSLYHIDFSRQLLNLVPRELAESYCLVPIFVRRVRGIGETLYVAMDDPSDERAQGQVSQYAGLPVRSMIAPPSDIRAAIRVYYGAGSESASLSEAVAEEQREQGDTPSRQSEHQRVSDLEVPRAPEPVATGEAAPPAEAPPAEAPPAEAAPADAAPPAEAPPAEAPSAEAPSAEAPSAEAPPAEAPPAEAAPSAEAPAEAPPAEAAAPAEAAPEPAPPRERQRTPAPESGPRISAREISMPAPKRGRGARMITLTLLDGTQVNLPARGAPKQGEVKPVGDEVLTARDLVAALRAVAHGADATEILGENARWEAMFAALLSLLLKKHLIADWEFVEEYKKI
jgi:type IV pilus assembly protein PilB